jgi:hypothetical protein
MPTLKATGQPSQSMSTKNLTDRTRREDGDAFRIKKREASSYSNYWPADKSFNLPLVRFKEMKRLKSNA